MQNAPELSFEFRFSQVSNRSHLSFRRRWAESSRENLFEGPRKRKLIHIVKQSDSRACGLRF